MASTVSDGAWSSSLQNLTNYLIVRLPVKVIDELSKGDLDTANALFPEYELTPYLVDIECQGVWRRRVVQIAEAPGDWTWVTRIVVRPILLVLPFPRH
jgi:hypothetical protein